MKRIKLTKLLLLTFLLILIGCVKDDEFAVPKTKTVGFILPEGSRLTDIDAVLGAYNSNRGEPFTFASDTQELYISGYVISSDEGGNFFKELIIQDKPENPTAGIQIKLDENTLYSKYEFGRKIFVKMNGLSVAEANGVIQLGVLNGLSIDRILTNQVQNYIIRDSEVATIIPLEVNVLDFTNELESLFIRLSDMQFRKKDVLGNNPKTFASEDTDQFDGERILESCTENVSAILSTSTFSGFKSLLLPKGRGAVNGVLTRDFFDSFFTIVINTPEGVNFYNTERCDPNTLDCGTIANTGINNLFSDNFENQTNNQLVTGNGWTNYIESGSQGWEVYRQAGTNASQGQSARVGARNSGDLSTIAWLITPIINLEFNSNVSLSFETSNSFSDGSEMQIVFSTNWDGTDAGVQAANWGLLPAAYIVNDSDFFGDWLASGNIDLNCGDITKMHLGFRYIGSGNPDFDGTYELDNVIINAN